MTRFGNRAIAASAGTGKTYRLAHRFIGLMAAGVEPDRICALTFSRRAAGEIFDKIVEHLCGAATDDGRRAATAAVITKEGFKSPPARPAAYVKLLRTLLDHGHRLRVGTLDSFILGVVRAFPLELGIPPETQPMDGDGGEALAMRQGVLTRLFDPTQRSAAGRARTGAAFLDDFRQARFGLETKTLMANLDTIISDHHDFFRRHAAGTWQWGAADRIWQPHERWWGVAAPRGASVPADLAVHLAAAFGTAKRPQDLADTCADIAARAMEYAANKPWPSLNENLLEKLLRHAARPEPPSLEHYRKQYPVPSDLWLLLRGALANLVGVEVERALARTRGLRSVLEHYDRLYAEALSTDGRYTFDDLSRLLGSGGASPSRRRDAPNRLYIDYRLDGTLDHWLLDEFQDTSDTQWEALENLVDEVVQSDERSFFYVGDVKQSVYGWRGGNHRLFGQVLQKYATPGSRAIEPESMAECHRSLPAIIRAVNGVFDTLDRWTPEQGADAGPQESAVKAFMGAWKKHKSARAGEGEGFASLVEYVPKRRGGSETADDDAADDPAEFEAVAAILESVKESLGGMTAAVLVRSNKQGRNCVDVLRRQLPDVPVVHEGKGGITDSPVVTVLMALVRHAAHPGDTVALRHLQMSPLAALPAVRDHESLPRVVLESLHEQGFADTLRAWGALLGDLDAFGRQRLRELLAAAEEFDATGNRDPDAFEGHIAAHEVKAGAAAGTVRVMTIHQAKGLGFDLVIVPFAPNARSFAKPGDPDLLAGDDWVLDPPRTLVLEAAGGAPVEALRAARAEANFAQLCVLYVALTRAQQALYMVVPSRAKDSGTVREADLLRDRLADGSGPGAGPGGLKQLFSAGDPAWFTRTRTGGKPVRQKQDATVGIAYAEDIVRREPSKEHAEGQTLPAQWFFKAESGDVRAFGSAIHRLFEKIEWIEDADVDGIVAGWRGESSEPAAFLDDVERQFRACLANPDVRRRLARPAGVRAEVWREAPFDMVMETKGTRHLMSGRFDRLVVERDAAGRPVRAAVFDFKSNRVDTEEAMRGAAEGYAVQMADYARAAARLLGLPVARIATVLLFTRTGRTWPR